MSFTKINHYEKEYADTHHECALTVTEGVENQPVVNPYFVRKQKARAHHRGIRRGHSSQATSRPFRRPSPWSKACNPDHYAQAQEIIEACLPHAGKSVRIGITGVPGAGKSTFIEAIGNMVTSLRAQAGGTGHRPQLGAQRRFDPRRQDPHGEHLVQSQGLHPPLPFGRVAGRRGPQNARNDHPVRSRRIRRHLHRNGRRRDSPRRPYIRWSTCSCCCRSPVRATNCRASSAASWRWPT